MEFRKPILYIIVAVVIALFLGLFASFLGDLKNKQKSPLYYKQGLNYYKERDFQNAYYNFSKIPKSSNLYLNALYKQAKCADELNDKKTAIKKYSLMTKYSKNENIAPYALWRIGHLHLLNSNEKAAKKTFLKLRKNYKETEYGIAANYKLASLDEKNKKEYLINYIKYSPSGRFTKEALNMIFSEKIKLSTQERVIIAISLYENKEYLKAVNLLKDIPIELSWVNLIKCLDKLQSKENIIKVGQKGFSVDNTHFDEETLNEVVLIYIKASPKGPLGACDEIYNLSKDERLKAIALYRSLKYLKKEEADKRRVRIYERFQDSGYAPLALHKLFIDALTNGKITLAAKYGKIHLSTYEDKRTTPSVLYFMAYLKKKYNDNTYKTCINKLMTNYPNTYWAYRAYVNIVNPNFSVKGKVPIKAVKIDFPFKEDKTLQSFFVNIAKSNDAEAFDDFRIKDPLLKSWIEYKKERRAISSVLARNYINDFETLPKRNHISWKLAYPIYYSKEINSYSDAKELTPYLILSLIKEESHFDPTIRSNVGATGLMQIMPSTAQTISGKRYSINELKNPRLNIALGTKYFEFLMKTFSRKEPLCVLAYNAGPNAVKKWVKDKETLSFDLMMENVPYPETKEYIKKVYASYWNYLLTYGLVKI